MAWNNGLCALFDYIYRRDGLRFNEGLVRTL